MTLDSKMTVCKGNVPKACIDRFVVVNRKRLFNISTVLILNSFQHKTKTSKTKVCQIDREALQRCTLTLHYPS